jgi:UBA/TS-N domain
VGDSKLIITKVKNGKFFCIARVFLLEMAELRLGADAKHPNPGYLQLLTEMGYTHGKAVSALLAVKNDSLDAAIDWLDSVCFPFSPFFSFFR